MVYLKQDTNLLVYNDHSRAFSLTPKTQNMCPCLFFLFLAQHYSYSQLLLLRYHKHTRTSHSAHTENYSPRLPNKYTPTHSPLHTYSSLKHPDFPPPHTDISPSPISPLTIFFSLYSLCFTVPSLTLLFLLFTSLTVLHNICITQALF